MKKYIDEMSALEKLNNSKKMYLMILEKFIKKYSDVDIEISKVFSENSYEEARLLTHSMKGLSGNLGAEGLRERAAALEKRFASEDSNFEREMRAFSEELQHVNVEISEIIKRMKSED